MKKIKIKIGEEEEEFELEDKDYLFAQLLKNILHAIRQIKK